MVRGRGIDCADRPGNRHYMYKASSLRSDNDSSLRLVSESESGSLTGSVTVAADHRMRGAAAACNFDRRRCAISQPAAAAPSDRSAAARPTTPHCFTVRHGSVVFFPRALGLRLTVASKAILACASSHSLPGPRAGPGKDLRVSKPFQVNLDSERRRA